MIAARIVPSSTFDKILRSQAGLNEYLGFEKEEVSAAAALASNLYEQGRHADARAIFEGLCALDPGFYLGHAGLGAIDLIEENPDSALAHLTRAAELNPGDPSVQANLGEALLRAGKFADASRAFERALELDPAHLDPGANRARAIIAALKQATGSR